MGRRKKKPHWNRNANPGIETDDSRPGYIPYQNFNNKFSYNADFQPYNSSYCNNLSTNTSQYHNNFNQSFQPHNNNTYLDFSGQNISSSRDFNPRFPRNLNQRNFQRNVPQNSNSKARNFNRKTPRPTNNNPNAQRNMPQNGKYNKIHFQRSTICNYDAGCDDSNIQNFAQSSNYDEMNTQSNNDHDIDIQMNTQTPNYEDTDVQMNTQNPYYEDTDVQMNTQNPNYSGTSIPFYRINKKFNPQLGNPKTGYRRNRGRKNMSFVARYNCETDIFNEKGYIIRETLYRDPSLFYGNDGSDDEKQSLSNETSDETSYWQKCVDAHKPETPVMTQSSNVSKRNQNHVEKTLNSMLAKPVEMSKGKSLLQKMGWTGGGLGKDGDGIVEPIAPKATYAVNTLGLGHVPVQSVPTQKRQKKLLVFAEMKNKKLKHPEFQCNFYTNVLQYILEFVKNDRENKLEFEPRLRKIERKRIHLLVEMLRESDSLDDFYSFDNLKDNHVKLVQDIWVHNCYDLWTESENKSARRERCLGLYKEAPAHVYLVTPENLNGNDEQTDINDEDPNIANFNLEKDSDYDDSNTDEEEDIKKDVQNINGKGKLCHRNDVKKKQNAKEKQLNDKIDNDGVDIKKENDTKNTLNVEQNDKSVKLEVPCSENEEKNIQDISVKEENVVKEVSNKNNDEKSDVCSVVNENVKNEQNLEDNASSNKNNDGETVVCSEVFENVNNEQDLELEENQKVDVGNNSNNNRQDYIEVINKSTVDINEHTIKIEQIDIMGKIVEYFKEFCDDEIYKEFRFLGPFDDEEVENINMFFNICLKYDHSECNVKTELMKLFDDNSLTVLVDNNGKT
ncbi:putative uncharacterized protein DDB_G0282133 isoform X2 [Bicyclus anynana]|uniref:G-patch domain-containing protein n=1 Tax=Bicyclus anynana TaxID=110368 RepID=A0A6J1NS30_BICAN|nr:putative uncharacterized protein DDB_G0282133 isoform X2 [Bicyclus anynana]